MINYHVTGLRVTVDADGGTVYGVARVKYNAGHTNAGHYEVERADGPPLLVPAAECRTAPDWDETPEEGRFTGVELYRPHFLDDTGREYLSTGSGVIVPGDMKRLRRLTEWVEPDDLVRWVSHGSNEFRGDVEVSSVDAHGFGVRGPANAPQFCRWPVEGDEFEVDGLALHFVRVPPKRTGKSAQRSLSLTFWRRNRY